MSECKLGLSRFKTQQLEHSTMPGQWPATTMQDVLKFLSAGGSGLMTSQLSDGQSQPCAASSQQSNFCRYNAIYL